MLSDVDISTRIKSGSLKITPFEEGSLTGVGYDLRLGDYGYSLITGKKFDINTDRGISIGPQETVVLATMEEISMPNDLSGTIHSQVRWMDEGLQAISTTADPGWVGTAHIHITNNLRKEVRLPHGATLCTICFHELKSPSHILIPRTEKKLRWQEISNRESAAQQYDKKAKSSWKNRLLSKRFLLIFAISIIIVAFIVAKTILNLANEMIAIIVSVMTLLSMFVIEAVKSD